MLDPTITISGIVALCAIISPIFVAIINNRHSIKIKKTEMFKDNRIKAIENYMIAVNKLNKHCSGSNEEFYEKALGPIMLYVSTDALNLVLEIDDLFELKYRNRIANEDCSDQIRHKIKQLSHYFQKSISK